MKYFVQIFVYFVLQHLPFIGTVTIDFKSTGYIGESIVLQCQDTLPTNASSVKWFWGGSLMDISASRYNQTKTPTGFNLTISFLVTTDAGEYHCGIAFGISRKKGLTIHYNTTDVSITQLSNPKAIKITFIAFPDPKYEATVKEDGVPLDVNWNVYKSTQASGAIKVLLQNLTAFTNQNKIYTVHVNITSPVQLDVEKNITWVSDLTTQRSKSCELELGLGLGLSLGIQCVITCIVVVIFVYKGYRYAYKRGLALGLGAGFTCLVSWIIIAILISTGNQCKLELGLGLGLGSGIPCVITLSVAVIFVFKGKLQEKPQRRNREELVENPTKTTGKLQEKPQRRNREELVENPTKTTGEELVENPTKTTVVTQEADPQGTQFPGISFQTPYQFSNIASQPYFNQTNMRPSGYQISQPQPSQGVYTQKFMFLPPPQYSSAMPKISKFAAQVTQVEHSTCPGGNQQRTLSDDTTSSTDSTTHTTSSTDSTTPLLRTKPTEK